MTSRGQSPTNRGEPGQMDSLTSSRLIARNSLLNIAGLGLPFIVAALSIPYLIGALGTDRFGVLALVWGVMSYFNLFDLGLGRALTKLVTDRMVDREDEVPPLIWTALMIVAVLGLTGLIIVLILSHWFVFSLLNIASGLREETVRSFYVVAMAVPALVISVGASGILAARQRFDMINAVRVPTGLAMFVAPLLVLPFSTSLIAIAVILVVSRYLSVIALLGLCFRTFPAIKKGFAPSRALVAPLLRFGGWLTVSNILSPMMVTLDRFLIGAMVSLSAVAYYTTPYEAATRICIIPTAVAGVLFPAFSFASVKDPRSASALYTRSVKFLFLILLPISLVIVTLSRGILRAWLGADFADESTLVLQLLVVGVFFNSLAHVPFAFIQGAGRPDITAKLHLAELPFYLVLVWLLIRWRGIEGAAFAWTFRMAVDSLLLYYFAGRLAQQWLASAGMIAASVAGSMLLAVAFLPLPDAGRAVFLAVTLTLYTFISWKLVLSGAERDGLTRYVKRGRRESSGPEAG